MYGGGSAPLAAYGAIGSVLSLQGVSVWSGQVGNDRLLW